LFQSNLIKKRYKLEYHDLSWPTTTCL